MTPLDDAVTNPIAVPPTVVKSVLHNLGNVSGSVALNIAQGNLVTCTLTGATTFKAPENLTPGNSPIQLVVNSGTGFAFSLEGVNWVGTEPTGFASGAANQQYVITILPVEGKLLAVVGRGETGAPGAEGPEGAKGEPGAAKALEANARITWPMVNGSFKRTGYYVPTQYKALLALVSIPVNTKELKVYAEFGAVAAGGHVRTWAYDVGATTAGKYTPLAVSGLYEPAAAGKQELIATLKRKEGEWKEGELILLGFGTDNVAIELPDSAALHTGSDAVYPGEAIHGAGGITSVPVSASIQYSNVTFTAEPTALGEGSVTGSATTTAFLVSCV